MFAWVSILSSVSLIGLSALDGTEILVVRLSLELGRGVEDIDSFLSRLSQSELRPRTFLWVF